MERKIIAVKYENEIRTEYKACLRNLSSDVDLEHKAPIYQLPQLGFEGEVPAQLTAREGINAFNSL